MCTRAKSHTRWSQHARNAAAVVTFSLFAFSSAALAETDRHFLVKELPQTLNFPGYTVKDIVGFEAWVNLAKVKVTVPVSPEYPDKNNMFCAREEACNKLCPGKTPARCKMEKCQISPMFTLPQWHEKVYTRLKINANWFNTDGPPNYPHVEPCTTIHGLSISNGAIVSRL